MSYKIGDRVIVSGGISSFVCNTTPDQWTDDKTVHYELVGKLPVDGETCRLLNKYTLSEPQECIILGWTTRKTGVVRTHVTRPTWYGEGEYSSYNYLDASDTIKCWIVMPVDGDSSRYRRPFAALPEQIEPAKAAA